MFVQIVIHSHYILLMVIHHVKDGTNKEGYHKIGFGGKVKGRITPPLLLTLINSHIVPHEPVNIQIPQNHNNMLEAYYVYIFPTRNGHYRMLSQSALYRYHE